MVTAGKGMLVTGFAVSLMVVLVSFSCQLVYFEIDQCVEREMLTRVIIAQRTLFGLGIEDEKT